jgi:hypothetical protein
MPFKTIFIANIANKPNTTNFFGLFVPFGLFARSVFVIKNLLPTQAVANYSTHV